MKINIKKDLWVLVRVLLGGALAAAAFSFLTYPNHIVSGGVTGTAQIINLLTGLPVGVMVIVMNIPLFAIAWRKFGTRFILFSLVGMLSVSLFIDLFSLAHLTITNDMLLASVYGGLVQGLGYGLIYSTGNTAGGSDIGTRLVRRRYPHLNFGTISLAIDVVVVAAFAIIFGRYDTAMYTIIMMFVSSRIVNLILYGLANSGICYIITIRPNEIAAVISERLGRGATVLTGKGAYSGEDRYLVLCAVKRHQIPALRRIVTEVDDHSFVIVTQSHEVFGQGFANIASID